MTGIIKYRRSAISVAAIAICVFLLTTCMGTEEKASATVQPADSAGYVGSAACARCHASVYEAHLKTAHFHTSEQASAENIHGSFNSDSNTFQFSTGGMVKMEKRQDGFYQAAYSNGVEKLSQRFDIVFGSGTKGQSFATWSADNRLLQLPITYFTSKGQWSNSPGNPNKIAVNRVVTSRCLECHSTYAQTFAASINAPETFNRNNMVLGVGCERCHGAGAKHIAFQQEHPAEKKAQFIINPASFSRQQSLDMCMLCHGGRLQKTQPSFSFQAGDKLADYFAVDTAAKDPNAIDVHGNQYGLLAASKCFRMSQSMTCGTCHSAHTNEAGNTALFSQKCVSCHGDKQPGVVQCILTASLKTKISDKCTSCHMPELPSKAIAVLLQGMDTLTPAKMHTHFIQSYPEETKKILAFIKGSTSAMAK